MNEDTIKKISNWIKEQPKSKLIVAGAIMIMIILVLFYNPQGGDYIERVEKEIKIAIAICENSEEHVMLEMNSNKRERLKSNKNTLNDIPVNGAIPKLKLIPYPKVVFFHTGYAKNKNSLQLFCTFTDPRGRVNGSDQKHYYDYSKSLWLNDVNF